MCVCRVALAPLLQDPLDRDASLRHGAMPEEQTSASVRVCVRRPRRKTGQLPALGAARAQGKLAFIVIAKPMIKENK